MCAQPYANPFSFSNPFSPNKQTEQTEQIQMKFDDEQSVGDFVNFFKETPPEGIVNKTIKKSQLHAVALTFEEMNHNLNVPIHPEFKEQAVDLLNQIKFNSKIFNQIYKRNQIFLIAESTESSTRVIGNLFNIKYGSVSNHINSYKKEMKEGQSKQGRPSVFMDESFVAVSLYLQRNSILNRVVTINAIYELVKIIQGDNFSKKSLSNWINEKFKYKLINGVPDDLGRYNLNSHDLYNRFKEISKSVRSKHASLVFNLDEIGFQDWSDRKGCKVLVPDSYEKNDIKIGIGRNTKRSTVLCCISLEGRFVCPLIIINNKSVDVEIKQKFPYASVSFSETGFITKDIFVTWCINFFVPMVINTRVIQSLPQTTPAILLMDNFSGHLDVNLTNYLKTNNIEVNFFLPHSSHLVQPLDLVLFGNWKKKINNSSTIFKSDTIKQYQIIKEQEETKPNHFMQQLRNMR